MIRLDVISATLVPHLLLLSIGLKPDRQQSRSRMMEGFSETQSGKVDEVIRDNVGLPFTIGLADIRQRALLQRTADFTRQAICALEQVDLSAMRFIDVGHNPQRSNADLSSQRIEQLGIQRSASRSGSCAHQILARFPAHHRARSGSYDSTDKNKQRYLKADQSARRIPRLASIRPRRATGCIDLIPLAL